MNVVQLLQELETLDIKLNVQGDKLLFDAPSGALSPQLRQQIVDNRSALVKRLSAPDQSSHAFIARRTNTSKARLSSAQQRLWFMEQMSGPSAMFNIPVGIRLRGVFEADRFALALNRIAERHEVLRTSFVAEEGIAHQEIDDEKKVPTMLVDLAGLSNDVRESKALELAATSSQQCFDLTQAPLLRCLMIRMDQEDHVVVLTIHHIIADNWSIGLLVSELMSLYEGIGDGSPPVLPELPIQYADYAEWQREQVNQQVYRDQLEYWHSHITRLDGSVEILPDRPRTTAPRKGGRRETFALSSEVSNSLKQCARSNMASTFMLLYSLFQLVVSFRTGEKTIVLGTDVANRTRSELEPLIGFFVNQLVLQTEINHDHTFVESLQSVKTTALEGFSNQELPFDELVASLDLPRNLTRAPLFQIKFILQNAPYEQIKLSGLSISSFDVPNDVARSDITLNMYDTKDGVVGSFTYNPSLYTSESIQSLAEDFIEIARCVAAAPDTSVCELHAKLKEHQSERDRAAHESLTQMERLLFQKATGDTGSIVALPVNDVSHRASTIISIRCTLHQKDIHQSIRKIVDGLDHQTADSLHWTLIDKDDLQSGLNALMADGRAVTPEANTSRPATQTAVCLAISQVGPDDAHLTAYASDDRFDEYSLALTLLQLLGEGERVLAPESVSYINAHAVRRLHAETLSSPLSFRGQRFWREKVAQLEGCNPKLAIAHDQFDPSQRTLGSAKLTEVDSCELNKLCSATDIDTETLLTAAWALLLARFADAESIGMGRCKSSATPWLKGPLSKTLPMRIDIVADQDVSHYLSAVEQEIAATSCWHSCFTEECLEGSEDAERLRYQIAYHAIPDDLAHSSITNLTAEPVVSTCALRLRCWEHNNGIEFYLDFDRDSFDSGAIDLISKALGSYVNALVTQASGEVGDLAAVDQQTAERHHERLQGEQSSYQQHGLILDQFERWVDASPDAIAVTLAPDSLTYAALDERASVLAHYLTSKGVAEDSLVAICTDRSIELVVAIVAVLKSGGAFVPIDPADPPARIHQLLSDLGPACVLYGASSNLEPETPGVASFDLAQLQGMSNTLDAPDSPPRIHKDQLAYVIFTSGSTGKPKGVMNTHAAIANRIWWMQDEYRLTTGDRVVQKTPYTFDVSVWEFLWPLTSGACMVLAKPEGHRDATYLSELFDQDYVTTAHFVPSMLHVFLQDLNAEATLSSMSRVLCSGEALSVDLQTAFSKRFHQIGLHNLYGPTEAAIDVTYWPCDPDFSEHRVPIGRAISNIELRVLDANKKAVVAGQPGELFLGGAGLARGYLNRRGLTAQTFIPDPYASRPGERLYSTGDSVYVDSQGLLHYLGRIDSQVKVRGMRVEVGEIEHALRRLDTIADAVVDWRELEGVGWQLVAYLVANGTQTCDAQELREALSSVLPAHLIPAFYQTVTSIPLSRNGKTDRKALPMPDVGGAGATAYEPPGNPVEQTLVDSWAQILGLERVGIHDNFFERGGHSLLAVQVVAAVRSELKVSIGVHVLFKYATVKQLAAFINVVSDQSVSTQEESESDVEEFEI